MEFKQGYKALEIGGDDASIRREFGKMDSNSGGYVLFDEFCFYMATKAASVPSTPSVDAAAVRLAVNAGTTEKRKVFVWFCFF